MVRRNKGSKGHRREFYDLQPRDWMTLKAEFKELVRKLIQLDMNVIVTARQTAQYADSGFMRVIGETFDGDRDLLKQYIDPQTMLDGQFDFPLRSELARHDGGSEVIWVHGDQR